MNLEYVFFSLLFYLHSHIDQCNSTTITYISTERPIMYWFDPKVFRKFYTSSKRVSRRDQKHYVEVYVDSLYALNNMMKMDFYFYQFLTNRYKPSFVEMHLKVCDLINTDLFFGQTLRDAFEGRSCPFPPGIYHLKNMSLPYLPIGFPFAKGRIYINATLTVGGVTRDIARGSIDMEIKVVKIN